MSCTRCLPLMTRYVTSKCSRGNNSALLSLEKGMPKLHCSSVFLKMLENRQHPLFHRENVLPLKSSRGIPMAPFQRQMAYPTYIKMLALSR
jgi:hypothetical protein